MPGAYAHITAVRMAAENLDAVRELPQLAGETILRNIEYVQLGALGPDFPYLDIYHRDDKAWADAMHYDWTGDRIRAGMDIVGRMQGDDKLRALAWLLGFSAHVVTDVTIHPVVEIKVGAYKGHETEHRTCEMHQDVYIFTKKSGLDFHEAEFLKRMTKLCSDPAHGSKIHPAVGFLWEQMLQKTDGPLYIENEPHIDAWHYWFSALVGGVGDDRFLGLARHVLPWLDGVAYPLAGDENRKEFIDRLEVPGGGFLSYDEIFDRAVGNVRRGWAVVASDVLNGTNLAEGFLRNWDLDTGRDKQTNLRTFWS